MKILHHHIKWQYLVSNINNESIILQSLNTWTQETKWGEDWLRLLQSVWKDKIFDAPIFKNQVYFSSWTNKKENVKMWKNFPKLDDTEVEQEDYAGVRIGVDKSKLLEVLESRVKALYPKHVENQVKNYIGIYNLKEIEYHSDKTLIDNLKEKLKPENFHHWAEPDYLLGADVMNLPCKYRYQGEVRMYIYYDQARFENGIEVPVGNFNDFISDICFDPRLNPSIKAKRIEMLKSLGIDESKIIKSELILDDFQKK